MKQKPRFSKLQEWLLWQESLHYAEIDLGLERVRKIYKRLALPSFATKVITVGGTNGKGSTVAILEAIYVHAGLQVGSFTSPHVSCYNERIKLQATPVKDEIICEAFNAIDCARGDLSLTYFEFNTLAALYIFAQSQLDIALLEVGLGGRLDATNIIDADVSIITSIGFDHQEWLGASLESIAREKAGILRPGKPAVCAESQSFDLLSGIATSLQVPLSTVGRDYDYRLGNQHWEFVLLEKIYKPLPMPALKGRHQVQNAAAAIMAVEHLRSTFPVTQAVIEQALISVRMLGRFQVICNEPKVVLDVAHNTAAVEALCKHLDDTGIEQLEIVFGMLKDKDMKKVLSLLDRYALRWYVATLDSQRSFPADVISEAIAKLNSRAKVDSFENIANAYQAAKEQCSKESVLLVTGSFLSVSKVLALASPLRL